MAGASQGFTAGLVRWFTALAVKVQRVEASLQEPELSDFERGSIRRRLSDMRGTMDPWTSGGQIAPVECYTGNERRSARDPCGDGLPRSGTALGPGGKQCGVGGCRPADLHRPHRALRPGMEPSPDGAARGSRRPRGKEAARADRGALLSGAAHVRRAHVCHLVGRDRWHGLLLGKPTRNLKDDAEGARLVDRDRMERIRLDLRPRCADSEGPETPRRSPRYLAVEEAPPRPRHVRLHSEAECVHTANR